MKIKIFYWAALFVVIFCVVSIVSAATLTDAQKQALITAIKQQILQLQTQLVQVLSQQPDNTWCYTFNNNLQNGTTKASDVMFLHAVLQKQGISYSPDGVNDYLVGTTRGVATFQTRYAIGSTGVVDQATKTKLNQLYGCVAHPVVCVPNWQSSVWSTCVNNKQTRTVVDANNCGATTGKPVTSQTCCNARCLTQYNGIFAVGCTGTTTKCATGKVCQPTYSTSYEYTNGVAQTIQKLTGATCTNPVCNPSWQTGSWGACTGSSQTRTVTDSNSCGTTSGKPDTTQSCTACVPSWQTGSWGACTGSSQTRTVTDANNCGVTTGKPVATQSCTIKTIDIKANDSDGPANTFLTLGNGAVVTGSGFTLTENINLQWTGNNVSSCVASDTLSPSVFSGYEPSSGSQTINLSGNISTSSGKVTDTFKVTCVSTTTGSSVSDSVTVNLFYTVTGSCTPNWQTDDWGTCTNSQQTRTVIDLNGCGSVVGKPATTQSCTPICVPHWQVGSWGTCTSNSQTRTATDSHNCGITTGKPATTQPCNPTQPLSISCSSYPNPTVVGQSVTFTANATGGTGPYTYAWYSSSICSSTSMTCTNSFTQAGDFEPLLTVTSGTESKSIYCPVTIQ